MMKHPHLLENVFKICHKSYQLIQWQRYELVPLPPNNFTSQGLRNLKIISDEISDQFIHQYQITIPSYFIYSIPL